MTDIFLSYNREDLPTARRFAEAFEREGLSVWWDQSLNAGEAYDHVTERALKEARAVVVLWSKKSVLSRWVRAEATLAERNGTLVPVMIEACERPIMFELTHTAELSHWNGAPDDPAWRAYLAGVIRFVRKAPSETAQAAGAQAMPARRPKRRGLVTSAIVAVVLMAAGAGWWLFERGHDAQPGATTALAVASTKPRIAILPFENLSPDPANAFFADGMHEEVLSALSNSAPGLEVISRTTMMTYRAAPKPVAEIARELGATYVLEGSVRREGEDVRLTLQLIDAKSDGHLWSQNFNRKLVKAMTLQSEIASAVASRLAVQLAPAVRVAAPPTRDPVAYDLYLQARLASRALNGGTSREEIRRIFGLYSAAIARDPDFGLAYLGRVALGPPDLAGLSGMDEWQRQSAKDLAAARRLLGDDPRIALFEAVNANGGPFRNVHKVLELFEAAEAQGVNDPEILVGKTSVLPAAGRMDEALTLSQRLVTLDPANARVRIAWAANLWLARQPEQALRVMDRIVGEPFADAETSKAYRAGLIYAFTGDKDALVASLPLRTPAGMDTGIFFAMRLQNLRFQNRYAEILQLLRQQPGPLMPSAGIFEDYNLGIPPPPVAEIRGWADLLLDDKVAAKADGKSALDLVGRTEVERRADFDWLLRLRGAAGHLFSGDNANAIAAAREGMALMPRPRNALYWAYAVSLAAGVLAWTDQKDEAAALLEQLADEIPGAAPATIARDPIYTVALADNARFQALKKRLEAKMAATRL